MLSVIMQSVIMQIVIMQCVTFSYCSAECHYAEFRYTECRGTSVSTEVRHCVGVTPGSFTPALPTFIVVIDKEHVGTVTRLSHHNFFFQTGLRV
jgi:hypothetical protein